MASLIRWTFRRVYISILIFVFWFVFSYPTELDYILSTHEIHNNHPYRYISNPSTPKEPLHKRIGGIKQRNIRIRSSSKSWLVNSSFIKVNVFLACSIHRRFFNHCSHKTYYCTNATCSILPLLIWRKNCFGCFIKGNL